MRALVWPLAVALGAAAFAPAGAAPARAAERRVQLELMGLLSVGEGRATLLVLREKGAKTILPMLLSGTGPGAVASDLAARRPPGLMGVTLRALGARVQEIELLGSEDQVEAGRARLAQGGRVVDVSGRPSELVVLAVATGAPMYISRHLLDSEGLTPDDIERARKKLGLGQDPVKL